MVPSRHQDGQVACIWYNVPRQSECHILVTSKPIPVVPKVILWPNIFVIEDCILPPLNDLVPNDDLVQLVARSFILGRQVQEQLLHVPVEQGAQVSLQVKDHKSHVILLPGRAVVWHIPHEDRDGVDVRIGGVVAEGGGHETDEGEARKDTDRVRSQGMTPRKCTVHFLP